MSSRPTPRLRHDVRGCRNRPPPPPPGGGGGGGGGGVIEPAGHTPLARLGRGKSNVPCDGWPAIPTMPDIQGGKRHRFQWIGRTACIRLAPRSDETVPPSPTAQQHAPAVGEYFPTLRGGCRRGRPYPRKRAAGALEPIDDVYPLAHRVGISVCCEHHPKSRAGIPVRRRNFVWADDKSTAASHNTVRSDFSFA